MKEAVADILQTRMDKCTTEQFWAVGALTAFGAFLISQKASILNEAELPAWAVVAASLLLALYVAYLIVQRHTAYYALLTQLIDLVTTDSSLPQSVRDTISGWRGHSLSGVSFYLACDVCVTIAILVTYL